MEMKPVDRRSALIVVDVTNDFVPGVSVAALPVDGGDQIIKPINALMAHGGFDVIIGSQCWHPDNHESFKKQGGPFPKHGVAGTWGSWFEPFLESNRFDLIVRKGQRKEQFSVIDDAIVAWLRARGICSVYVCGLALDFCVKATCEAAIQAGFVTYLYRDLTRAVFPSVADATVQGLERRGVRVIR
jgi:nicotinamidase/pyrazinamidase